MNFSSNFIVRLFFSHLKKNIELSFSNIYR